MFIVVAVLLFVCACGSSEPADGSLGALQLGLTSQAGGVSYRLSGAHFTLEGPEPREFTAPENVEQLELELPQGAYRLTLDDGYSLTAADFPDAGAVPAKLVSANPAPVSIRAGETSRVALRFELGAAAMGDGKLQVGVEISDGGASGCESGLRINELDYDQPGADDAEFIELLHTGTCPAALAELSVELVNGGDGKVYGRYPLADVAPALAPGERLVIGDPAVLAKLPMNVKRVMLNASGLQNGPDGVRLVHDGATIDAVAYDGAVTGAQEGEPAPAEAGDGSIGRCPDGFDTNDGGSDFQRMIPTSGAANTCV